MGLVCEGSGGGGGGKGGEGAGGSLGGRGEQRPSPLARRFLWARRRSRGWSVGDMGGWAAVSGGSPRPSPGERPRGTSDAALGPVTSQGPKSGQVTPTLRAPSV
ncbi:hypothetical protein E2C01_097235 [Portunus trituberculatus]|uniref:Uncharacterized protein n=1 Tax=Portunus trituberculatus TaxID=210409 RepID=A0A5B7KAP8_PORTR|nr:hypothetical protein [Portunus trituberculatus]